MARINNLRLVLVEHNHHNHTAKVKVSYRLYLSAVERNMTGLRFKEQIQLWGRDFQFFDPDDHLYTFATETFPKENDGVVVRERTVILGEDVLNEDKYWIDDGPMDEIYARVTVIPLLPSADTRNSNQISHIFPA